MHLSDVETLLKLWKWAVSKPQRIFIAIPVTVVVFVLLYLLLFVDINNRWGVLSSWSNDIASLIGVPIGLMPPHWHVFIASILSIITVSCIITYIIIRVNKVMTGKVDAADSRAKNAQDKYDEANRLLLTEREEHEIIQKETNKELSDTIADRDAAIDRFGGLYSDFEKLVMIHRKCEQDRLKREFNSKSEQAHDNEVTVEIKANVRSAFEGQVYKIEKEYGDPNAKK